MLFKGLHLHKCNPSNQKSLTYGPRANVLILPSHPHTLYISSRPRCARSAILIWEISTSQPFRRFYQLIYAADLYNTSMPRPLSYSAYAFCYTLIKHVG